MFVVGGVDVGSLSTDVVLMGEDGQILSYTIGFTGASGKRAAEAGLAEALIMAGLKKEDVAFVVSTGYGRDRVPFGDKSVTEITCHGRGAQHLHPETRTIIDIGGQDSKVMRVDSSGRIIKFSMNDKCAAGTGRFLEVMARALELELDDMGDFSLRASQVLPVSSMCTVFAESEVISLLANGNDRENIVAGLHQAIAKRVVGLLGRVGLEERVCLTGGVAKNKGMVKALEEQLHTQIIVPEEPQIVGAVGAALIALEIYSEGTAEAAAGRG